MITYCVSLPIIVYPHACIYRARPLMTSLPAGFACNMLDSPSAIQHEMHSIVTPLLDCFHALQNRYNACMWRTAHCRHCSLETWHSHYVVCLYTRHKLLGTYVLCSTLKGLAASKLHDMYLFLRVKRKRKQGADNAQSHSSTLSWTDLRHVACTPSRIICH